MITRFIRLTLFALLISAQGAVAQQSAPEAKAPEPTIVAVAEWVRHAGKPDIFYGWMAKELRFSAGNDMPMMHKGYFNKTDGLGYGFHVFTDQDDVVMVRETRETTGTIKEGIIWRVTRAGKITGTLWTSSNAAKIVPNERYVEWWKETRNFFFERMKKDQEKAN